MIANEERIKYSRKELSTKTFSFKIEQQQIGRNLNENGVFGNGKNNYNNTPKFEPYLDDQEVKDGLEKGILIKGVLRVNQRNYEQCFIDNPDGAEQSDLLIFGAKDRNRAFHGDLVVVRLKPKTFWFIHESFIHKYKLKKRTLSAQNVRKEGKDNDFKLVNYHRVEEIEDWTKVPEEHFKKTSQVVAILEKSASRRVVGLIKPLKNNMNYFIFAPTDSRIPRLLIPSRKAPTGFYERPQDYENFIYLGELDDWPIESKMPHGKLLDNLGLAGDVEPEHKALIRVNAVDERDYESFPEVLKDLPIPGNPGEWRIDPHEFTYRRDFRDDIVITIDPMTARDLDDALHIKKTTWNENEECWEVGVHIADVAYFLGKGTVLDEWACKRGTSVYLVHQVIPMLPRVLCEELCSLNPGVDRLTFSVVWIMDNEAKILHTWFGRSIIRSCAKLSYEHAQDIIDNPTKQFAISEMPPMHSGRKIRDVKTTVRNLNQIAKKLKAKRFREGALKLDLPKLKFDLEKNQSETGIWQPRGIRLDERKEANYLVEEFMLLANMAVANRLYNYFKGKALLRRHPPPKKKELNSLVERCGKLGIQINSLNSKTLADSIKHYERKEEFQYTVLPTLNQMLMKCMHLAQYFCTGMVEGPSEFRHYALSVDFYTHFTSPIRRYPDVIVHRLLAASLKYCADPGYSIEQLDLIAQTANRTKATAKLCSEASGEIFFGALVRESGNFEALGVVMAIFDQSFDFLLLKYAIVKRVYLKKQKWLDRIHFGKLEEDGPVSLVLRIKEENGDEQSGSSSHQQNGKMDEESGKMVDIEEEDENDVEISEIKAPNWLLETRPEKRQTLNIMSVVRLRLVPLKNSVKYEANLIPTPDSNPLSWIDAKEYMENLPPNLGSIGVEEKN